MAFLRRHLRRRRDPASESLWSPRQFRESASNGGFIEGIPEASKHIQFRTTAPSTVIIVPVCICCSRFRDLCCGFVSDFPRMSEEIQSPVEEER